MNVKRRKVKRRARLFLLLLAAAVAASGISSAAGQEPKDGEKKAGESSEPPKRINLNTATLEELMELPEIGKVKAQRILNQRKVAGPFRRVEEIIVVPGISRRMFEIFRDRLTVEEAQPPERARPDAGSS